VCVCSLVYPAHKAHTTYYTGLFKMIVGVFTTCHTQYICDGSV